MNSGSSRSKVSDYIKKNRIAIPVIADVDRSLEGSAKLSSEISLKNIWQARVIRPDGSVVRANASDLEASMKMAAEGAAWNLDPAEFPDSMKSLWQLVEFGNYASAARNLKKKVASRNRIEKEAAKKLWEHVDQQLKSAILAAESESETDPWQAWTRFSVIESQFAGFDIPDSVEANFEKLGATDEVRGERAALKQLELARRTANRGGSATQRAVTALKKLIENYPDTEAAATARGYLKNSGG